VTASATTAAKPARGRRLALAVDVVLFGIAFWVLHRVLTQYSYAEILDATRAIGARYFLASLLLTLLGYAALVGYDYISLRLVGTPMPLRRMVLPSFVSFAVANSAPVSLLTGTGVRYRLFGGLGLSATETARVSAANVLTYVLGLFTVAGLAFVLAPVPLPAHLHLPVGSLRPIGLLFLGVVGAVLVVAARGVGSVRVWRWQVPVPPVGVLGAQVAVSSADWIFSSGALYVLLIAAGPVSYPHFLSAFLLAQIVTQVVPLPGGIGVFEALMLVLRPPGTRAPLVSAALLLYRVVYYLLPLAVAGGVLVRQLSRREAVAGPVAALGDLARSIAPHLLAVLTFATGAWLLLFGALPTDPARLAQVARLLPLGVIEGSHFLGSLVGTGLLLLGWGIERRIRGAFRLTVGLLMLGIPAALLRAGEVTNALLLLGLCLMFIVARREFNRTTPLAREPVDGAWLVAAVLAIVSIAWLATFAYQHTEYAGELWWRFTLEGDAPRAMRMAVGVLVVTALFVGARLVARARRRVSAGG
jgi:phosphatidylglycerol lysyltransferase